MTKEKTDKQNVEDKDSLLVSRPYTGKDRLEALEPDPDPDLEEIEVDEDGEEVIPDEDLGAEDKSYKKRYGDLRRHSQEQMALLQEQVKELNEKLKTATPKWTPPKSDADLAVFAEENPDAYDILVSIAAKQAQNSTADVESLRAELENTKRASAQEQARHVLLTRHPDWDEIREDDAFHAWAEEQPKSIQDGIYANATDGALAARILDLYKTDKGISSKKDKNSKADIKKAAATLVDTKESKTDRATPKATFTRSQIANMTIQEYEANEAKILAAQRDGLILNE